MDRPFDQVWPKLRSYRIKLRGSAVYSRSGLPGVHICWTNRRDAGLPALPGLP